MKKILFAVAATLALTGSAFATDHGRHHGRDRHVERHYEPIPDRVEVRYVIRENRRVKITTTYHCERQRRDRCLHWSKHVERDVMRRHGHRHN